MFDNQKKGVALVRDSFLQFYIFSLNRCNTVAPLTCKVKVKKEAKVICSDTHFYLFVF